MTIITQHDTVISQYSRVENITDYAPTLTLRLSARTRNDARPWKVSMRLTPFWLYYDIECIGLFCSKFPRYGQHSWIRAQTAKSIIPNSSVDCTHRPIRFLLASDPVSNDLHSSEICSIPSSHFDRCRLYSLVQESRSEAPPHSTLLSGTKISFNSSDRKLGRPLSKLYTFVKRYIVNSVRRLEEAMIQDSQVGCVREISALQIKPVFAARKARS
jgi:hypothetical protein